MVPEIALWKCILYVDWVDFVNWLGLCTRFVILVGTSTGDNI